MILVPFDSPWKGLQNGTKINKSYQNSTRYTLIKLVPSKQFPCHLQLEPWQILRFVRRCTDELEVYGSINGEPQKGLRDKNFWRTKHKILLKTQKKIDIGQFLILIIIKIPIFSIFCTSQNSRVHTINNTTNKKLRHFSKFEFQTERHQSTFQTFRMTIDISQFANLRLSD